MSSRSGCTTRARRGGSPYSRGTPGDERGGDTRGGGVVMGREEAERGPLVGRAPGGSVLFGFFPGAGIDNEGLVEWLVRFPGGGEAVSTTATSEKGGVDRTTVTLG